MKTKSILTLLIAVSLLGCKKDEKPDTSLKTVTYTFVPNGTSSSITYKSVQSGKTINIASQNTIFSVGDQVAIGDKTTLILSTAIRNANPTKYEIRVSYNNKQIGFSDNIQNDGASKFIILEKTFTKEDFK